MRKQTIINKLVAFSFSGNPLLDYKLAEMTDVGLGNIPQVIEGMKETGYLIPLNNKTYVWKNRKALLERWIAEYATVLRPKLVKERYALKGNWQEIPFDNHNTVWGGEPAADILTNHLRPEKFLIYTKENRMDMTDEFYERNATDLDFYMNGDYELMSSDKDCNNQFNENNNKELDSLDNEDFNDLPFTKLN